MPKKRIAFVSATIVAFFAVALLPRPAHADGVTLTLSTGIGSPGNTITLDGTITNSTTNTVYLNGEDFTLGSSSFLNGDTTDFFLNAPLSLSPGESSGLIALLTFDVAPGTLGGTYVGNLLSIIGGTDSADFTDVLTTSDFAVNVNVATPTPEPSSLILLLTGLLVVLTGEFARRLIQHRNLRRSILMIG